MPVHTEEPSTGLTMIGALASEAALQEAIDHALERGNRLQILGTEFSSCELLATMRLVQALTAGYDLECSWELGLTRPTATATITDPERVA